MRSIYCDNKDCLNSEIINAQLSNIYSKPSGWREIKITSPEGNISIRKEYCPSCSENIAVFNRAEPADKKRDSLEEILRNIVQEEISEM